MPGTISFLPSEADYVSASRATCRRQLRSFGPWRRLLAFTLVIATLVAVVLAVSLGDIVEAIVTALVGGIGGFLAGAACVGVNYLLLPRRAGRLFHQQRPLHAEQVVTWDDARLHWQGPGFTMDTAWGDYYRWSEARDEFLLFVNEQMPQFIPRRALSVDEAADLHATLVAHGPPRR